MGKFNSIDILPNFLQSIVFCCHYFWKHHCSLLSWSILVRWTPDSNIPPINSLPSLVKFFISPTPLLTKFLHFWSRQDFPSHPSLLMRVVFVGSPSQPFRHHGRGNFVLLSSEILQGSLPQVGVFSDALTLFRATYFDLRYRATPPSSGTLCPKKVFGYNSAISQRIELKFGMMTL